MGGHAVPERPVLGVYDAKVSTRLFHQSRNRRVVDVADPRKQVVLDLEVQTAEEPRRDPARPSEVDGGLHLMDGPGPLDTARAPGSRRERPPLSPVSPADHNTPTRTPAPTAMAAAETSDAEA